MFCPEGFKNITGIYNELLGNRLDEYLEFCRRMCRASDNNRADNGAGYFFTISPADFLEHSMFRLISNSTYIASPSGTVLSLDLRTATSVSDFWEYTVRDLEDAVERHPEVGPIPYHFRYAFRLFNFPSGEFLSEFDEALKSEPTTDIWGFAKSLGLDYLHHQLPLFFEREGYTITLDMFDYIDKYRFIEQDQWRNLARILRPFEGWSICVPNSFAESLELKTAISKPSPTSGKIANQNGRPDHLRVLTQQAYESLYASGHGATPWYVVLREVTKQTGLAVSLDTLKRAVSASKTHVK